MSNRNSRRKKGWQASLRDEAAQEAVQVAHASGNAGEVNYQILILFHMQGSRSSCSEL
jgi:hypothetical protein